MFCRQYLWSAQDSNQLQIGDLRPTDSHAAWGQESPKSWLMLPSALQTAGYNTGHEESGSLSKCHFPVCPGFKVRATRYLTQSSPPQHTCIVRTDKKKSSRRAFHVICCLCFLPCWENIPEPSMLLQRGMYLCRATTIFTSPLISFQELPHGLCSLLPLSILSSSLCSWIVLASLGEPIAAEHPIEVNATGWSAVASWDLSTPCSCPKALSSPWLSGISYFFATFPTSF